MKFVFPFALATAQHEGLTFVEYAAVKLMAARVVAMDQRRDTNAAEAVADAKALAEALGI